MDSLPNIITVFDFGKIEEVEPLLYKVTTYCDYSWICFYEQQKAIYFSWLILTLINPALSFQQKFQTYYTSLNDLGLAYPEVLRKYFPTDQQVFKFWDVSTVI